MKLLNKFKSFDIYGHPIGVNYRGDGTFTTFFGSIMTLFTVVLVLTFAGIELERIVTNESQEETSRSVKIDVDEDKLYLQENNF